jgi:hypothetical protein
LRACSGSNNVTLTKIWYETKNPGAGKVHYVSPYVRAGRLTLSASSDKVQSLVQGNVTLWSGIPDPVDANFFWIIFLDNFFFEYFSHKCGFLEFM